MVQFLTYIQIKGWKIVELKEYHVKTYVHSLKEEGYASHTIATKQTALRLYFEYLRFEGFISHHPMEHITQPKTTKREASFTSEALTRLFDAAKSERDKVMMQLAAVEKIPFNVLIALKKKDYDKNQRIVYARDCAREITESSSLMLTNFLQTHDYESMFVNQHGKALSQAGVYYLMKNYLRDIGLPEARPIEIVKVNMENM